MTSQLVAICSVPLMPLLGAEAADVSSWRHETDQAARSDDVRSSGIKQTLGEWSALSGFDHYHLCPLVHYQHRHASVGEDLRRLTAQE
jgi:hypothetical protein